MAWTPLQLLVVWFGFYEAFALKGLHHLHHNGAEHKPANGNKNKMTVVGELHNVNQAKDRQTAERGTAQEQTVSRGTKAEPLDEDSEDEADVDEDTGEGESAEEETTEKVTTEEKDEISKKETAEEPVEEEEEKAKKETAEEPAEDEEEEKIGKKETAEEPVEEEDEKKEDNIKDEDIVVVPRGVQHNLPVFSLGDGWTVHYEKPYSDTTMLADVQPESGRCLLWGAKRKQNYEEFEIAAIGLRERIQQQTRTWDNGVFWYTEHHQANGFACDSKISLAHADNENTCCESRLSWHLDSPYGGYRAGCEKDLFDDNDWQKVVMSGPCKFLDEVINITHKHRMARKLHRIIPKQKTQYPLDMINLAKKEEKNEEEEESGGGVEEQKINISFNGVYVLVVGQFKPQFLDECNEVLRPVKCINTSPGGDMFTIMGTQSELNDALAFLEKYGLDLPNFGRLEVQRHPKLYD